MKSLKFLLIAFLLPCVGYSQASIICPPDVEIDAENLDETYTSYGDPLVTDGDDLNLTKEVTVVYNSCQSEFSAVVTLTYVLVEPSTNNPVASCNQIISLTPADLDDIVYPQDQTFSNISVSDAKPSLTGFPNLYDNNSNIFISWSDEVLLNSADNSAKIIRTWLSLYWCTGSTEAHVQIITIENPSSTSDNSSSIITCHGGSVSIDDVVVSTNDATVTIDPTGCTIEDDNIKDFVNCIVANNPIADGFDYNLEVIKNGNHINGVSTLDLILIQRHILGIETFDNPCDVIAADVSNNQEVTAIDLVEIRKLILGVNSIFPNSPAWKFVNDEFNGQSANPLSFGKEEFPLEELNIVAIKIGDVNNSAIGN